MRTNTYRLAVALQAKAIDSIDLHAGGVYTAAHSFGENITVVARYRTGADQRILQMWAHDADAHLLGSAEASTPLGGGVIASHVTAFRGDHLRWERRIIPTAEAQLGRRTTDLIVADLVHRLPLPTDRQRSPYDSRRR